MYGTSPGTNLTMFTKWKKDWSLQTELSITGNQISLQVLNLCEYKKGEKHFVLIFFIKGQRNKKRVFTVGRFNDNLNVVTGETIFGINQCQERLKEEEKKK